MSEMIERVARAMCQSDGDDPERYWRDYEVNARAAIEAMREPTEAMIAAGHLNDPLGCDVADAAAVYPAVWEGMINAALSEAATETAT